MSDYMMDFSNDDLESGKELCAAPDGEYRVRISDWKTDEDGKVKNLDKNGNPFIMPILEIVDCEEAITAKSFMHYLPMLHDDMDEKKKGPTRFALHEFWTAFGIDYQQPFDPEDCIGATADALLIVQEDQGYGEQNKVKRFIVSH